VVPRLGGVCAIAGLLIGCGVDEIDHLPDHGTAGSLSDSTFDVDNGGQVFESAEVSGSGGGVGDTNFPDPALIVCGGLDGHPWSIDGLRSAWAVVALPGSTYSSEPIDAGSIRVRLGAQPLFDCQDRFEPPSCLGGSSTSSGGTGSSFVGGVDEDVDCGWALSFTLAPTETRSGTYRFEDLVDPDFELVMENSVWPSAPITGELEISSVTPTCIVGRLSGLGLDDDVLPLSGAFAAMRCDRRCLPGPGRECD
jgi:hypothetical protein